MVYRSNSLAALAFMTLAAVHGASLEARAGAPPPLPTMDAPGCLPSPDSGAFFVADGTLAFCTDAACFAVADTGSVSPVARPPEGPSSGQPDIEVFTESSSARVGSRTLALTPPPHHAEAEDLALIALRRAGERFVASWTNCAGPCTVGQLVDRDGRSLGKAFDFVDQDAALALLAEGRLALFGSSPNVRVIDDRGRTLAFRKLSSNQDPQDPSALVSLGGRPGHERLVALWQSDSGAVEVRWLSFDGKRLSILERAAFETCP